VDEGWGEGGWKRISYSGTKDRITIMDLTRNTFRKIILFSVVLLLPVSSVEYLPFFSDYELLEEQLHQGYISKLIGREVELSILIVLLLTYLISLFLLYFFKPIGRTICMGSYLLMIVFIMISGDMIQYSLSYPIELLDSFLEIFILYLIYLTPLKKEFEK